MSFIHCNNGHIYDDRKYKECPFCSNSENSETVVDASPTIQASSDQQYDKTIIDDTPENTGADDDTFPIAASSAALDAKDDSDRTVVMEYEERPDAQRKPKVPNSGRRLEGFLVSYQFNKFGDYYPLYIGKNYIGRSRKNDIRIDDASVSSEHALLLFRGNKILIEDKLSVNGTFINNSTESIDRAELNDNDILKFGKVLFKLKAIGTIQ